MSAIFKGAHLLVQQLRLLFDMAGQQILWAICFKVKEQACLSDVFYRLSANLPGNFISFELVIPCTHMRMEEEEAEVKLVSCELGVFLLPVDNLGCCNKGSPRRGAMC